MAATDKESKSIVDKGLVDDTQSTSSRSSGKVGRGAKKGLIEAKTQDTSSNVSSMDKPKATVAKSKAATKEVEVEKPAEVKQVEKKKKDPRAASAKRSNIIEKTINEAKEAFGNINTSEGRTLRKRPDRPVSKSEPPKKKSAKVVSNTDDEVTKKKGGRGRKAAESK